MDRCLLGFSECSDERNCPVHEFWSVKKEIIRESMKQITLDQVAVFEGKPGGRIKVLRRFKKTLMTK